ncbi:MAG: ShlB/FhaC/HecB family hemolysin secretion/activation protein [Rhodospirillales bacterium]|nr:ShlB/FhaC/HecB family hemolysin secretion/activation protein [Rhodospirillales bacterium]
MGRHLTNALGRLGLPAFLLGLVASLPSHAALPAGPPLPQGSPLQHAQPAAPLAVQPAAPAAPLAISGGVPNRPVPVARVLVEGATAYPAARLAAMTTGLVGPATPLPRIEAAREAILRQYRDDGYVLTSVSASLGAHGTLRFLVTEGRIASVKLSGDIGPAGTQVLRFLDRLTEQRPITSAALERALLLAQSVPGVSLHAVLQPSASTPGALNLIAEVHRQVVSDLLTADNYASSYTGPVESLAVIDLNSFTEFGDQTEISLYHTWPNSETFGQISEQVFLGGSGLRLRVYGGSGRVTPTGVLAAEGYLGNTEVFGARLTYPLIRARQQSLEIYTAFDGLDSDISTASGGVRARASYDAIRVLRVGADYARSDLLAGNNRGALNTASISFSHGLPILGAARDGATDAPRTHERTDFFKFTARLSRTQTLFQPWRGASVAAMGLFTGQWTTDILPPAEEFYLGGFEYTRGYYAGQVSGDKGVAATAELQLNTPIDLHRVGLHEDVQAQFFAFYDWGEVWQNDPAGLAMHVSSAGGGVRLAVTRFVEIDLLGLHRFNVYPTGTGAAISALPGSAFYWRVQGRF